MDDVERPRRPLKRRRSIYIDNTDDNPTQHEHDSQLGPNKRALGARYPHSSEQESRYRDVNTGFHDGWQNIEVAPLPEHSQSSLSEQQIAALIDFNSNTTTSGPAQVDSVDPMTEMMKPLKPFFANEDAEQAWINNIELDTYNLDGAPNLAAAGDLADASQSFETTLSRLDDILEGRSPVDVMENSIQSLSAGQVPLEHITPVEQIVPTTSAPPISRFTAITTAPMGQKQLEIITQISASGKDEDASSKNSVVPGKKEDSSTNNESASRKDEKASSNTSNSPDNSMNASSKLSPPGSKLATPATNQPRIGPPTQIPHTMACNLFPMFNSGKFDFGYGCDSPRPSANISATKAQRRIAQLQKNIWPYNIIPPALLQRATHPQPEKARHKKNLPDQGAKSSNEVHHEEVKTSIKRGAELMVGPEQQAQRRPPIKRRRTQTPLPPNQDGGLSLKDVPAVMTDTPVATGPTEAPATSGKVVVDLTTTTEKPEEPKKTVQLVDFEIADVSRYQRGDKADKIHAADVLLGNGRSSKYDWIRSEFEAEEARRLGRLKPREESSEKSKDSATKPKKKMVVRPPERSPPPAMRPGPMPDWTLPGVIMSVEQEKWTHVKRNGMYPCRHMCSDKGTSCSHPCCKTGIQWDAFKKNVLRFNNELRDARSTYQKQPPHQDDLNAADLAKYRRLYEVMYPPKKRKPQQKETASVPQPKVYTGSGTQMFKPHDDGIADAQRSPAANVSPSSKFTGSGTQMFKPRDEDEELIDTPAGGVTEVQSTVESDDQDLFGDISDLPPTQYSPDAAEDTQDQVDAGANDLDDDFSTALLSELDASLSADNEDAVNEDPETRAPEGQDPDEGRAAQENMDLNIEMNEDLDDDFGAALMRGFEEFGDEEL